MEQPNDNSFLVPSGTPAWIDQALIEKTIAVWQRFYTAPISTAEAIEMVLSVSQLCGALRTLAPPVND